jgi:hypothetical protein
MASSHEARTHVDDPETIMRNRIANSLSGTWFYDQPRGVQIGILAVVFIVLVMGVWLGTRNLEGGVDWFITQRPATLLLLQGRSPYDLNLSEEYDSISYYYNPPWTLIPLIPLAILPPAVSRAAMIVVSIIASGYCVYKLGASPGMTALFLLSPPVLMGVWNANIDWMVLLGFVLPPQIGLFFVVIKPQMGLMVAVYWLIQSFRQGGLRETVRVFWPITLVTLLSFALFGLWPLFTLQNAPADAQFNASLWPYSIPAGLVAMAAAFRKNRIEYAMAASPCFTTYITFHSWVGAVAALAGSRLYMTAAIIGLWLIGVVQVIIKLVSGIPITGG